MSQPNQFDPYYLWLGIPPDEQPADYYRLLGVRRFETNADVIDTASQRQIAHVRSFAIGPHGTTAQRVLNELAKARIVLLDPQRRKEYDQRLQKHLASQAERKRRNIRQPQQPAPQPQQQEEPGWVAPARPVDNIPVAALADTQPQAPQPTAHGTIRQPSQPVAQRPIAQVAVPRPASGPVIEAYKPVKPRYSVASLCLLLSLPMGGLLVLIVAIVYAFSGSEEPTDEQVPRQVAAQATDPAQITDRNQNNTSSTLPTPASDVNPELQTPTVVPAVLTNSTPGTPLTEVELETDTAFAIVVPDFAEKDKPATFDVTVWRTPTEAQVAQIEWSAFLNRKVLETNGQGIKLVFIPPGKFKRGEEEITITEPYYVGQTEITRAQWQAVMQSSPWEDQLQVGSGDNLPATYVTWEQAQEFCERLSDLENVPYRLLTEAEWEFACRAGTVSKYSFGDGASGADDYAWFLRKNGDAEDQVPHEVAAKLPNAFDLFDMHGNVWEICLDAFQEEPPVGVNPLAEAENAESHVIRGGGVNVTAAEGESAARSESTGEGAFNQGFRIALPIRVVVQQSNLPSPTLPLSDTVVTTATPHSSFPKPSYFSGVEGRVARERDIWAQRNRHDADLTNQFGVQLLLIPGGYGRLGSLDSDPDARSNEKPQVSNWFDPFFLGKHEVTQSQWAAVMNDLRPRSGPGDLPVTDVSWEDAMEFCRQMNLAEERSPSLPKGWTYRLPSESEWEYASRTYNPPRYCFGDDAAPLTDYGWFSGNTKTLQSVGRKLPNAFGIYDLHGGVWEWCLDAYQEQMPEGRNALAVFGDERVYRGGSFLTGADLCRHATRSNDSPHARAPDRGFRVAASPAFFKSVPLVEGFRPDSPVGIDTPAAPNSNPLPLPPGAPAGLTAPFNAQQIATARKEWAAYIGRNAVLDNSVGMAMLLIPPGRFQMGAGDNDAEARENERPQVQVTLTQPFYVGQTEVTQAQWSAVTNTAPWSNYPVPAGDDYPAHFVTWPAAKDFCVDLTKLERQAGNIPDGWVYKLMTEAQWEYVCKAGTTTRYYFGDSPDELGLYAWCRREVGQDFSPQPVAQKRSNPFGLYDMHGNVWEWCEDEDLVPYPGGIDPLVVVSSRRPDPITRGGSYSSPDELCRSSYRDENYPDEGTIRQGLRVILVPQLSN